MATAMGAAPEATAMETTATVEAAAETAAVASTAEATDVSASEATCMTLERRTTTEGPRGSVAVRMRCRTV
jgi:hypothetical protein